MLLKDGTVAFDGPTHEAIVEYRRLLAGERNPEERAAGLKEWGGDTARVEGARLLGPDGDARAQGLLAGEPFVHLRRRLRRLGAAAAADRLGAARRRGNPRRVAA